MINVGVIGLGMMGMTHLEAYAKLENVNIVAVSDINPGLLAGKILAKGNIDGQCEEGFDLATADVKRYAEGIDLINDPDIEIIDICLPTPLHMDFAITALQAGRHILLEKPMARTSEECELIIKAAEQSPNCIAMPAMCMRFWPGWAWLKEAVQSSKFGKVLSAMFHRLTSLPPGAFYRNGRANGGAILDLHIHDTDFVQYCFGLPSEVMSFGYSDITGEIDHVLTRYKCKDIPLITAEGSWAMTEGFGFKMQYQVNFENATAVFDIAAKNPLTLIEENKAPQPIELPKGMGYDYEIAYLIECIIHNQQPVIVSLREAANSVRIIEAEVESIRTGHSVKCCIGNLWEQ